MIDRVSDALLFGLPLGVRTPVSRSFKPDPKLLFVITVVGMIAFRNDLAGLDVFGLAAFLTASKFRLVGHFFTFQTSDTKTVGFGRNHGRSPAGATQSTNASLKTIAAFRRRLSNDQDGRPAPVPGGLLFADNC